MRGCGALLLVLAALALAVPADAQIIQWRDDEGRLRFTDDITRVPEKYRSRVEHRFRRDAPVRSAPPAPVERAYVVPYMPRGALIRVGVRFRGPAGQETTAALALDTGATLVTISERAAESAGLRPALGAPTITFITADGRRHGARLIRIPEITVLGAEGAPTGEGPVAPNVVAAIMTESPGQEIEGLLGLSFLHDFKVSVDAARAQVTFAPLDDPAAERHGGRGASWWRRRFTHLEEWRQQMDRLVTEGERLEAARRLSVAEGSLLDQWRTLRDFVRDELKELTWLATVAGVPDDWRGPQTGIGAP